MRQRMVAEMNRKAKEKADLVDAIAQGVQLATHRTLPTPNKRKLYDPDQDRHTREKR